jgi:hypothetical protein
MRQYLSPGIFCFFLVIQEFELRTLHLLDNSTMPPPPILSFTNRFIKNPYFLKDILPTTHVFSHQLFKPVPTIIVSMSQI